MKKSLLVFIYLLILALPMISLFLINVVPASPAYEDYTTFTESGSGDDGLIVVDSSTQVTFLLPWYKDRKLYKDYGTSYFGSSFTHFVDITPYAGGDSGDWESFWAVTNTISHRDGLSACLYLGLYDWTSQGYRRMFLSSGGGLQSTKDYLSSGTTYYMKITRSGSSLQAKAYGSASNRLTDTSPLFTLSVTIASQSNVNYRYLWAVFPLGGNSGGGTPRHVVRNLDLRVEASETTIFEDDFESYGIGTFPSAGGWELWTSGAGSGHQVVVDSFSNSPTKSLQLLGQGGWGAIAALSYSTTQRFLSYEVSVRINELGTYNDIARVGFVDWYSYPTTVRFFCPVAFRSNGSIRLGGYGYLQTFVLGEWYRVKQVTDRVNDVSSVWINDVLKASNVPVTDSGPPRPDIHFTDTTAFALTSFWAGVEAYFDDVKLIESAQAPAQAITILSPQNKAYAATSVPLTFTVNETTSWMGYSLDDQANVTVTGNTTLTGLLEGSHHVVVYANSTGGTMWASGTVYFTVDTTPPTVSVLSPENTTYTSASVPLTFTINEATSWIGYSLDDEANVTISGNTALNIQTNGSHSVIVYAKDMAGNTAASNRVFFTVELPVSSSGAISVEPSKTIVALGQTVTATITITDIMDCVGYQFVIDYDATVLEYVGYTFDTDPANPLSPTQLAPASSDRVETDASVLGSVKLATVWKAGVPAYSGSGVAAEVTFQAIAAGNSALVFDQSWTRAVDHNANDILFGEFSDSFIAVVVAMQSISVDSSNEIVQSGQTVTVTVNITDITDCAGYQFKIDYNPTILTLDSWTFDTGTPLTPSQMAPTAAQRLDTDVSVPGSARLATVWKAGVPTYSGSGVAAEVTFQTLTAGNCTLVFDQLWTIAVDSVGEEIIFGGFDDGWVVVTVQGDVDGDHDVDVADQRKVQLAMFSTYPDPLYVQYNTYPIFTDVDGDLDVDVGDQRKQQLNMFQSW